MQSLFRRRTFGLHIFNDGTAEATDGTSKSISILPTATLEWEYNKSLEFSIFTIPVDGLSVTGDWTVTVDIANDTPRKFKLTPTVASSAKLVAGQIHEINVPSGFAIESEWTYSTDSWLTTVPRNVYISDLSLPGAWYATDSGYQGSSLEDQYKAGIRAFNIDCRLSLSAGKNISDYDGNTNRQYQDVFSHSNVKDTTILTLACAGTEKEKRNKVFGYETTPTGEMESIGLTVKQALIRLGGFAAANPNEYIQVILTISQKPKTIDSVTGNDYVFSTVNPKMVLRAITIVLNDPDVSQYLYGANDGEAITPNTTIDDVKGKVVVKVNLNSSDANLRSWNLSAPMLISEGSMAEKADADRNITVGNFSSMNGPAMYWSNTYVTDQTNEGYMNYYYHHAQNTTGNGGFPTVANRKTAIQDILSKSYSIYKNNTHDAMFQIGIGGWTSDNDNGNGKTNLSSQLKPYVLSIVNSMLSGGQTAADDGNYYQPAPVGAVLMNHATAGTTHSTQALIDAIIKLNGKYFLNNDPNKPAWPSIPGGGNEENPQPDPNQGGNGGS